MPGGSAFPFSIQRRKLRLKEGGRHAQGHSANTPQSWGWNPCHSALETVPGAWASPLRVICACPPCSAHRHLRAG